MAECKICNNKITSTDITANNIYIQRCCNQTIHTRCQIKHIRSTKQQNCKCCNQHMPKEAISTIEESFYAYQQTPCWFN